MTPRPHPTPAVPSSPDAGTGGASCAVPGQWRTATTQLQSVVVDACWRPMVGDEAGDFHDVIDLKDGRIAVVVGDAPGYGPAAAAIAEDLRAELRRAFRATSDMSDVFARIDARLQAAGDELIATVACMVVDPGPGVVHIANAGHLPLVLCQGGTTELVDVAAEPPLGLGASHRVLSRPLGAGSVVFLYTDGLIERRGTPLDQSIDTLVGLCDGPVLAGTPAADFARRATATFGQPSDDATVVAVRLLPLPAAPAEAGPSGAGSASAAVRVYLDPADLRSAELQEVVAALVRRLEGRLEVQVDVFDITSSSSDTEDAGVLAAPTIVRVGPGPPVRVIGWFRSPEELARALQLPLTKEDQ